MIVPLIELSTDFTKDERSALYELVESFGILGRVALQVPEIFDAELLEECVVVLGGAYEIQLLFSSFDEALALRMLNAGANQVLVQQPLIDSSIPVDRWRLTEHRMTEVDVNRIGELWKKGDDCLVDIADLKAPSMLAEVLIAVLRSDRPDGLWPTVIVDRLGVAIGLAYSSSESLKMAIEQKVGVYYSRSRSEIWVKGKTSGAMQQLLGVRIDCDFDTLKFTVDQGAPGFCHKGTHSCFGVERSISEVLLRLESRVRGADSKSFTKKLFEDPEMLGVKLREEAEELLEARSDTEAAWEGADVLYFSLIAMMRNGAALPAVYKELARRMQRVVRRKNKLES